jgi:DMSO/TMAO reductase YedYZ molybdopterin-dependent catalytic subunit
LAAGRTLGQGSRGLSSGRCCGAGKPLGASEFPGDVGNAKAGRLDNVRPARLAALVPGQGVVGRGVLRDDGWSASVVGIMPPIISRGFRGRREDAPPGRVPPGQYVTRDFPVLSAGPTPHTPLERWDFTVVGEVDEPRRWTWEEFRALPAEEVTVDIHCVTKWSKLDTVWRGVRLDTLLEGIETSADYTVAFSDGGYTTNVPLEDLTGGKAWVAFSYAGEPLPPVHGGPARMLVPHLYFWKSAKWVRGLRLTAGDEPGFWETNGYHNYGDPWREQRYWGD